MDNFDKQKMIIRREYYETTGRKPEDSVYAYGDYLERKLVKKSNDRGNSGSSFPLKRRR